MDPKLAVGILLIAPWMARLGLNRELGRWAELCFFAGVALFLFHWLGW
jgi:hypothetical protein